MDESKRWLRQAEVDVKSSDWNKEGKFFEIAFFMSQQGAGKALISFLYFHGKIPIVRNSTLTLAKECLNIDKEFEKVIEECKDLDKFHTTARYPDSLPDGIPHNFFEEDDANSAIKGCKKIVSLVRKKVIY